MKHLLFILFLVAFALGMFYYWIIQTWNTVIVEKRVTILPKTTILGMKEKLKLSMSDFRFRLYLRLEFPDFKIQAGNFLIPEWTLLQTALSKHLIQPVSTDLTLTILPWWNLYDIESDWKKLGLLENTGSLSNIDQKILTNLKKKFLFLEKASSLEWFLLPETYNVRPSASLEEILTKILSIFESRIVKKTSQDEIKNFYQHLILASIVEKEERKSSEKPIVAGILRKRLEEGIALGADATTCYPFRLTFKECTPRFISEHIQDDTPYNLRKNRWLPPTPISNPSAATWQATIHSEKSDYYFYLHDENGIIHYGKTLDEHNRNKMLYLWK